MEFTVQNLNAEVISIGTEILLGEITDTNAVHIAKTLRNLGINLYFMTSVGDNEQRIADAVRIACSRADIIFTTGGLGPTIDDMTRQGIAIATGRELQFHETLLDQIAERFSSFKVKMTDNNRRQAYLPDGAIVIENPVGTAPCFIVEYNDSIIITLPGVPREMKFLIERKVIPYLRERYNLGVIKAHILRAAGIGESALDSLIGEELLQQNNPTIGLAAHQGQIDIRITAKADTQQEADYMIGQVETQLYTRVGKYIFGKNDDTLENALAQLLSRNKVTITISETGIGDAVSTKIRSVGQGNPILALSQMFAHPDDLRQTLDVNDSVSLRDLASQTAEQITRDSDAIVGIAVVCHPDMAENDDKEQGTAVAIYTQSETRSRVYGFGGQFDLAKSWVSAWALANAWRMVNDIILAQEGLDSE